MNVASYIKKFFSSTTECVCVICLTKERSRLLHPCMHFCVCEECAVRIEDCPLCKTPVCARWRVYMS